MKRRLTDDKRIKTSSERYRAIIWVKSDAVRVTLSYLRTGSNAYHQWYFAAESNVNGSNWTRAVLKLTQYYANDCNGFLFLINRFIVRQLLNSFVFAVQYFAWSRNFCHSLAKSFVGVWIMTGLLDSMVMRKLPNIPDLILQCISVSLST